MEPLAAHWHFGEVRFPVAVIGFGDFATPLGSGTMAMVIDKDLQIAVVPLEQLRLVDRRVLDALAEARAAIDHQ